MTPWKPDVCLYHFPCDDGFAAAWVVRRKWPEVVLAPTNYGLPVPGLDSGAAVDLAGKNVLIADFSYPYETLVALSHKTASIVVLDHHKTAAQDLVRLPRAYHTVNDIGDAWLECEANGMPRVAALFDMERSGAGIAWDWCFPGERRPQLIRHIEDRDLWKMELEATRRISLFLRSYPYDFEVWDGIAAQLDDIGGLRANIMAQAAAIERFYDRKLAEMLPTATLRDVGKWKGVAVAHAPYAFASDLANELLKAHPEAPFAAVVVDAYGARTWSLRSEDGRQDVSEVAKAFGGGGHRNAAGFRVPV